MNIIIYTNSRAAVHLQYSQSLLKWWTEMWHVIIHKLHKTRQLHYTVLSSKVQAESRSASLCAVQSSWVPGRLMYTSLRHPSRRHLQTATRHHLTVPRYPLSTFGRRAFSVAGPTVWNSLLDSLWVRLQQGPWSHGIQGVNWPPTFSGAGSTYGAWRLTRHFFIPPCIRRPL